MLYLGYDELVTSGDGYALTANGRANATDPGASWLFMSVHIPLLPIAYPDQFRIASTKWLLESGIPFVYPIEFMYFALGIIEWDGVALARVISKDIVAAARKGQAAILFSFAHEAPQPYIETERGPRSMFDAIRDFAEATEIPASSILFIQGNLLADTEYRRWG